MLDHRLWYRLSGVLVGLALVAAGRAEADYIFTAVTANNGAGDLPAVALNNAGQVAFRSNPSVISGPAGVYVGWAGGPVTAVAIADNIAFRGFSGSVSINDAGRVAFNATPAAAGLREGIYTAAIGGPTTTIATSTGAFAEFDLYGGPAINNAGQVAFAAGKNGPSTGPPSVAAYYRGDGSVLTTIYSESRNSDFDFSLRNPDINESGEVAFYFQRLGGTGPLRGVYRGNGGTPTLLIGTNQPVNAFRSDTIVLNDAGEAITRVQGFSLFDDLVVFGDGDSVRIVADSDGPYSVIGGGTFAAGGVSFNDSGQLAFSARLDGQNNSVGIFTGPNPATDTLIRDGSALDGSTVIDLLLYRHGLNDLGQIAFAARLADGRSGIYVATPRAIPEPSSLALSLVGLGAIAMVRRRHGARASR